ncbi:hypothetical protein VTN77DRAFT_5263 [Rasamsonia byssochlamydoides]|uniref:uncharacterized protein n=1 Tax=Rasamsonia byssochlamydoides TaxID=89139 RepID=UPI00374376CD
MASSSPSTSPQDNDKYSPANINAARAADYIRFKRYAAWTFIVASPILIALPPRKLDLYTVALSSAFVVSANHLYRERHDGRGILDDLGMRFASSSQKAQSASSSILSSLPSERAQEIQAKLRAARDAQIREASSGSGSVSEEVLAKLKARQQQERSLGERIWMGNETEGWKERRLREEQKALEEGKGYGDLILDHIWEVWNWGKTTPSTDSSSSTADSTTTTATTNKGDKDSGGK